MKRDHIVLTLPRERSFIGVADLVLGGLAARLDLSYDELDDLQVAVAELLGHDQRTDSVTLTVHADAATLEASVGPLDRMLIDELRRGPGPEVGLRRVLETVVDDVEVTEHDGEPWVALRKSIQRTGVPT
jgi:anti-sigma regulatory factor (Ser/Thr protein kinase)